MAAPRTFDVVVTGGGPAGALAAFLLAREGLRVALVNSGRPRPRLEGVSPRVLACLRQHGLEQVAAQVGEAVPRTAHWNGGTVTANTEHLTERTLFDAALREAAQSAGAVLVSERVLSVMPPLVQTVRQSLSAPMILEARGRRRPGQAGCPRGPATLSVGQWFQHSHPVPAGTAVRPLPDGWLWEASQGGDRLWRQLVVAARAKPHPLRRFAALHSEAAVPVDVPVLRHCDARLPGADFQPDCFAIGDAAAAFDPLSGHGLFWALSSALMAFAIVMTLREDGGAAHARCARFYEDRMQETFWRQARLGRDFYRQETRFAQEPFWQARQGWPDEAPVHAGMNGMAHLALRPVVEQGRVREREVLVTPDQPLGIGWIAGVPLAPAIRWLQDWRGEAPPSLEQFHAKAVPQVSREAAGLCFEWLESRGLVSYSRITL